MVWSDYYDKQKKICDFSKSLIAEALLDEWKRAGNRTLWVSRQTKFSVRDQKTGYQVVRTTEGVRWQFTRELIHNKGKWTYEEFVALAKMFYCGEDQPEGSICLCGKNFLENIQCIDFSKHPEVTIGVKTSKLGWDVHYIHTAFGDFEFTNLRLIRLAMLILAESLAWVESFTINSVANTVKQNVSKDMKPTAKVPSYGTVLD